jgi:hypothetical protein
VTRVHVAQPSRARFENADEERGVHRPGRIGVDVTVERIGHCGEILAKAQSDLERRLDVGHEQGRADALPRDVAHQQRDVSAVEHEVIEKISSDLTSRHGHARHFSETKMQRRVRKHFVLNLPAELELATDAFLLHRRALMTLDVCGHAVEGDGEFADLVIRQHGHARVVIAFRNSSGGPRSGWSGSA